VPISTQPPSPSTLMHVIEVHLTNQPMHLMVAVKVAVGGNAAVSVTATLYGPKRNPTHVTLGLLLIINL